MKYLIAVFFIATGQSAFGQAKSIQFKPTVYYNNFSGKFPAVLKVQQGDTLKSESVDAGGTDKNGELIAKRGNPLTGPFFVSLNRDNATTVGGFVKRSLPMEAIEEVYGRNAKLVKWKLDTTSGYATPELVNEHLGDFKVPLIPFMGCLGVAAPSEGNGPLTYFADEYGGNMDFYKVTKGATIYLPVFHEGALLYIGDGHAEQGDGEINGDALETSMDFAFVAKVIKGKAQIKFPRIEDSEHIVAMAMDKTLEEALKKATLGLLEWLQSDYKLTLKEATQVIGPLIEYRIPTLAGPKVEVAAMIKKKYLASLKIMN
jgi:amidase